VRRFDFSLCMHCGICVEACLYDALFWSPEFSYAEIYIAALTHEQGRLREWMRATAAPARGARRSGRREVRSPERRGGYSAGFRPLLEGLVELTEAAARVGHGPAGEGRQQATETLALDQPGATVAGVSGVDHEPDNAGQHSERGAHPRQLGLVADAPATRKRRAPASR
jgi:ferredoxin